MPMRIRALRGEREDTGSTQSQPFDRNLTASTLCDLCHINDRGSADRSRPSAKGTTCLKKSGGRALPPGLAPPRSSCSLFPSSLRANC